jgi:hypothetical protein
MSQIGVGDRGFYLWEAGSDRPVISAPRSAPNFLPGFRLLEAMFESRIDRERAVSDDTTEMDPELASFLGVGDSRT